MHSFIRGLVLMLMFFSLVACNKKIEIDSPQQSHIVVGNSYYTQFVIRYEKNRHLTTNFRRGAMIPVNSKVKLLSISAKAIELELENFSKPLVIRNSPKHTGDDIYQAFDKLFGTQKVNLADFTLPERAQINKGTVAKGMKKNAVKVAIGYPPITETPSLDADSWVYWSGRFNKFRVEFKNGKVVNVID